MGVKFENQLLDQTVELTRAALESSNPASKNPIYYPDKVTEFMQAVFGKLKEINDSCTD